MMLKLLVILALVAALLELGPAPAHGEKNIQQHCCSLPSGRPITVFMVVDRVSSVDDVTHIFLVMLVSQTEIYGTQASECTQKLG